MKNKKIFIIFKDKIKFNLQPLIDNENKKCIKIKTNKYKIDKIKKFEIELSVEYEDIHLFLNTIKWIDDLIDNEAKVCKNELSIFINKKERIAFNPSIYFFQPIEIEIEYILSSLKYKNQTFNNSFLNFEIIFTNKLIYSKKIILDTKRGRANFMIASSTGEKEIIYSIYWVGDLKNDDLIGRIHYMCETSEIFDSIHCDCKEQLEKIKNDIHREKSGILIYAHEEGRGIGIFKKVEAYYNTEKYGDDTVEAIKKLGLKPEQRNFEVPADILQYLKVKKIKLYTNNPLKIKPLEDRWIEVNRMKSWPKDKISLKANKYIKDKIQRMGHINDI